MAKKKRRNRWDNLNKRKNLKLRQDYMDTFFINGVDSITGNGKGIRALTDKEKDWLDNFYSEYYNASVNHNSYDAQLHDNEDLVKDCYDRNNSRNRCLLNKGKATNEVEFRSWAEFDQDTINDECIYEEENSFRLDDYNSKKRMFNKINKIYPNLFEFEEFMRYDIELIFEKIKSIE